MVSAELLFGLTYPGGTVDETAFSDFIRQIVTPRFPGLTSVDAIGYWKGRSEPSKRMLILAPPTDATRIALDEIRAAYRTRFQQESVGLMLTKACADF